MLKIFKIYKYFKTIHEQFFFEIIADIWSFFLIKWKVEIDYLLNFKIYKYFKRVFFFN